MTPINIRLKHIVLALLVAAPVAAQTTGRLSENGWYADDVRADGTGASIAGTNLISPTLTDAPESASMAANPMFNAEIASQIRFLPAPGTVPSGTFLGAVNLRIGPNAAGKSQISHRDTSPAGHATGMAAFGPGMMASYSWMGDGTPSVTAGLKIGVRTSEFGSTGVSSRTGENAWDKVLIYEPGNLNGSVSDGVWHTETIDFSTGKWWFFDRTIGAGTIGMPVTLDNMSTNATTYSGARTLQQVYNLITAPGAVVTSVQFGIGSGNANGDIYVNQLSTNFYRPGMVTRFGCDGYDQDFEVDDFGWNVFGMAFVSTRVMSGTNGVPSAGGLWHSEALRAATNWGGYGAVCGCSSNTCAAGRPFPANGYRTSIDIYLNVDGGWANNTRFDFSSAINSPAGMHRRDFIFNGGFYNAMDLTGPGAGTNRFIVAASNNSPGTPKLGVSPIAIGTTGWYTFVNEFYDAGAGVLACRFSIRDSNGFVLVEWVRSDPTDIIGSTVGANRYGWFPVNEFPFLGIDNASYASDASMGSLALSVADCQDDVDPSPGYQIAVELKMQDINHEATGFFAALAYDQLVLAYRGDLSSYTMTPFTLHIRPALQGDTGFLELDGSVGFSATPVTGDATLAVLIFNVLDECDPASPPITFNSMSAFASELSLRGDPVPTALIEASPFTLDDTAPVLSACPPNVMQSADGSLVNGCAGAVVTFAPPTAIDYCDPSPVVTCVPSSGSFFSTGMTIVTCSAVDVCGNESSCMFTVTVEPTNTFTLDVVLDGVSAPTSRCIHFAAMNCLSTDVVVSFTDHDMNVATPVRGTAMFTLPCGLYDGQSICVKDEQHTLWASTSLALAGATYVGTTPVSLLGGDTDNDGDVDINDVTLFLAQFGSLHQPGGCGWNGTRDADFSNNGAIGSEDYNFLTSTWLMTSACSCSVPFSGSVNGQVDALVQRVEVKKVTQQRADLNADGWIDVLDVEVLERRLKMSGDLSRRMRTR